ncbi:MAG: DEAD/DEAH box helicase family protein [Thermomicrobiales bacterium]
MPINFDSLSTDSPNQRIIDPLALFRSLKVKDPTINDLWLAQGDALRDWDDVRQDQDVAIVLNTGAGKTLVGLLAARSIVNETSSPVIYACSSIQLIEQTASKAKGSGLEVSTYFRGEFSNDLYHRRAAPCVTTYQALLNGHSRFADEGLAAVVFDDAHTTGHLLRDQFTLHISRSALPNLYANLTSLFRPYFAHISEEMEYMETIEDRGRSSIVLVPPFAVHQIASDLLKELFDADLGNTTDTKFAWAHLRNHIELCAVLVSAAEVTFTPVIVPAGILSCFGPGVRRLYLSATLTAQDDFLRSFGRIPARIISPITTAGECERLILIPARTMDIKSKQQDIDVAKAAIQDEKSLVLVPTRNRKKLWDDVATQTDTDATGQIELFKEVKAPACLVLTARYDGVDLPGDTCRVLIIDGLPTGLNPLERFLWEQMNLGKMLRSTIASRIAQSFGRISRGMSDHGVVILTGSNLVEWILAPKNQALLPAFLQRQLSLGIEVSGIAGIDDLRDTALKCLNREDDWIRYYQKRMESTPVSPSTTDDLEQTLFIAEDEAAFGLAFWRRDYAKAAKALEVRLEETFIVSRSTGAWHALWLGYCYDLLSDQEAARSLYVRAHNADRHIPRFDPKIEYETIVGISEQAFAIANLLTSENRTYITIPQHFDRDLAALSGDANVPNTEAALEALGILLGLQSTRPDNEFSTGPDVVWSLPGKPALSIEAKTAKSPQSTYSKRDLGQILDRRQWVSNSLSPQTVISAFVGPLVPAARDANPDPNIMVIEISEFEQLGKRLKAALSDISATSVPISVAAKTHEILQNCGLLWPEVFETIKRVSLVKVPPIRK